MMIRAGHYQRELPERTVSHLGHHGLLASSTAPILLRRWRIPTSLGVLNKPFLGLMTIFICIPTSHSATPVWPPMPPGNGKDKRMTASQPHNTEPLLVLAGQATDDAAAHHLFQDHLDRQAVATRTASSP